MIPIRILECGLRNRELNVLEIWYHFSLLKNEFQKPKKLKESP